MQRYWETGFTTAILVPGTDPKQIVQAGVEALDISIGGGQSSEHFTPVQVGRIPHL